MQSRIRRRLISSIGSARGLPGRRAVGPTAARPYGASGRWGRRARLRLVGQSQSLVRAVGGAVGAAPPRGVPSPNIVETRVPKLWRVCDRTFVRARQEVS